MENIIRKRRKELGLSQEELAKKCGVSRQTVNAIENNKYDPTLSLAFRLAKELQLTVDELFTPSINLNKHPSPQFSEKEKYEIIIRRLSFSFRE